MVEIVSSAQMRAVERAAIDSVTVTGLTLMMRAGAGSVVAMFAHWPMLNHPSTQAVILCGPGNNGGDGYVIAQDFHARGLRPWVLALGQTNTLPPDAHRMAEHWSSMGQTLPLDPDTLQNIADHIDLARPVLIVDALFGIGLSRPLAPALTQPWAMFMDRLTCPVFAVAVDVPSGVSDQMPQGARLAGFDSPNIPRLTVTFHALKDAHRSMLAAGEDIVVVDIGLNA